MFIVIVEVPGHRQIIQNIIPLLLHNHLQLQRVMLPVLIPDLAGQHLQVKCQVRLATGREVVPVQVPGEEVVGCQEVEVAGVEEAVVVLAEEEEEGNMFKKKMLAQQIISENSSVKMIASEYGVQYILVGNVQFEHKKVRVAVQLINTETEMMLWSEIFTHDISISNSFETLDTIVYQIISGLEEFSCHFRKQKSEIQKEIKMEEVINNDIINLRETRRKKTV